MRRQREHARVQVGASAYVADVDIKKGGGREKDAPPPSPSSSILISNSLRGGGALLFLALLQRSTTFLMSLALQRKVLLEGAASEVEIYGAANISLELLLSTLLFIAREPFRVALARDTSLIKLKLSRHERDSFLCAAWLSGFVGVILSTLFSIGFHVYFRGLTSEASLDAPYAATVRIMCLAAALECISEPISLVYQNRLVFRVRVAAEGSAALVLGLCRYIFVAHKGLGLLGFVYAQLCSSAVLLCVYWGAAAMEISMHYFSRTSNSTWGHLSSWIPASVPFGEPERARLKLLAQLAGQGIFKHMHTEGDKMVLMRAAERSLYRQGVYALAHTYGSLVARLLLAPAEEASRLLFSKLGSSDKPQLGNILAALLKLVILIGALFPCFGFNYTGLLLSLLFMARKAAPGMEAGTLLDVSGVLSWYCVYVLLLAVNGMCEAFVYALASRPQLSVLTWSLAVSFAVFYAVANPLMAIYGTEGLVIANCAGMCFRIAFCLRFMFAFFGGCEYLRRSLPHWSIIICLSISFVLTSYTAHLADLAGHTLVADCMHVCVGIFLLLILGTFCWKYDSDFLNVLRRATQNAKGRE